jgi:hypothetical protein
MNAPPNDRPDHDEALIRALIAPGDGSIVDALMALPQTGATLPELIHWATK